MSAPWNPAALDRLRTLDPRVAEVFHLRCIRGASEADVAKTLGITARTVRRDVGKARLLLAASRRSDPPSDDDAELTGSPAPPKPPAPLVTYEKKPGEDIESE